MFSSAKASSGGFFQQNESFSPSKNKKSASKDSQMMPCTIAMICNSEYNQDEDSFKFKSFNMFNVTIVGTVSAIQDSSAFITYKIDDSTTHEPFSVRVWTNSNPDQPDVQNNHVRERSLVRVYGQLKADSAGSRSLCGFSIKPIVDLNEVTFHLLDVVYSVLHITKDPVHKQSAMALASTSSPYTSRNSTSNYKTESASVSSVSFSSNIHSRENNSEFPSYAKKIFDIISSVTEEIGIDVKDIRKQFPGVSDPDLQKGLEFLLNEGHIFSTIDDDHYRSADC